METPEEKAKQKAKIELEQAEKTLDLYERQCAEDFGKTLANEAASTVLGEIGKLAGRVVIAEIPVFGWIFTGLDIAGKVSTINGLAGDCYEEEINYWRREVREKEVEYEDRSNRAEVGKKVPVVIREDIRKRLIQKEMELKKSSKNKWNAQSEYRKLHEKVYGPRVWANTDRYSAGKLRSAKKNADMRIIKALQKSIK